MLWFTSDTHFSHLRIIELCDRPFKDVNHMNEMLINNWNTIVSPNDSVFHLGDVALGTFVESIQYVNRLNGYKVLLPGNHDRVSSIESAARQARFRGDYEGVFQEIADEWEYAQLNEGPGLTPIPVQMSHYPYSGDSQDTDRYVDMRPYDDGTVLLHGHTHSKDKVSRSKDGTLQIHVGVDAWDYRPVSEEEIITLIKENA